MALDFPDSPAVGDIFDNWQWDGAKWVSAPVPPAMSVRDTPPPNPNIGNLWYDSAEGNLYVWYNDGTSSQWVSAMNAYPCPSGVWTIVNHAIVAGNGAAIVTTPAIDTTGANLLVVIGGTASATLNPISDSKGNAWQQAEQFSNSPISMAIEYCATPVVGSNHTFSWDSANGPLCVIALASAPSANPYDWSESAAAASPGGFGPSNANCMVITAMSCEQAEPYTVDTGFTILATENYVSGVSNGLAIAWQIMSSPAYFTLNWSGTGANVSSSIISFNVGP